MERIQEIDGLRAIAVMAVFVRHTVGFSGLARLTTAGWIGVDLFFVISGYLITTILLDMRGEQHYFRTFYMRRTLRIFPPYYAVLLLTFLGAILSGTEFTPRLWVTYLVYGVSLVPFNHWYFADLARLPNPLRAIEVTWSLSIEELFYLLWAPTVRFLEDKNLRRVILAVLVLAPILRWIIHKPGQLNEYYFFPARIDSLGYGAWLALSRRKNRSMRSFWLIPSIIVSGVLLFALSDPQHNHLFSAIGYSSIALTMMLLLDFVIERRKTDNWLCRLLRSRVFVGIGTISYTMYLVHLFVILGMRQWAGSVFAGRFLLNRVFVIGGSLAISLAICALSWKYFESPILKLKDRFPAKEEKTISVIA